MDIYIDNIVYVHYFGMMAFVSAPTEQEIRDGLTRRADEFSRQTGMSKSEIGKRAVNDPAVLGQISEGRNFTIDLYRRLMNWLDRNWPESKMHRSRIKRDDEALDASKPHHGEKPSGRTRPATKPHFSQFKHLRTNHFRSAAEIEVHVNELRDEWSRR